MEPLHSKSHYCPLCDYKCAKKCGLEDHIRRHTREKPWSCEKCNHSFSTKGDLDAHVRRVHQPETKAYKCSLCSFATYKTSALEEHTGTHTGERSYKCEQPSCGYSAKSSWQLKSHNVWKHTNERNFGCAFPNCGYVGKTKSAVRSHGFVVHNECRPFFCDFKGCSYRAKTKGNLKIHKLVVHHGGHKPFACSSCSYRTTSMSHLRVHELGHAEEKTVKCNFSGCTYSCKSQINLQGHILSHHTEKTLKCGFAGCFFTTADRNKLKSHQKLHCEGVHKCPCCDYRAALPSAVRRHVESHHSSQCSSCPYKGCTYRSRSLAQLNRHINYHKAMLGCPVEGCDYAASSRSAWKIHMQLHDPTGRPFHCPLCPKYFARNSNLSQHLESHAQEKPFQCPACNFGAVSKEKLTRHIRQVHSRAFPNFAFDEDAICNHCNINFGCAVGLAMHRVKLKTAVVVLTRLRVKFGPEINSQ